MASLLLAAVFLAGLIPLTSAPISGRIFSLLTYRREVVFWVTFSLFFFVFFFLKREKSALLLLLFPRSLVLPSCSGGRAA